MNVDDQDAKRIVRSLGCLSVCRVIEAAGCGCAAQVEVALRNAFDEGWNDALETVATLFENYAGDNLAQVGQDARRLMKKP